jgi:limonene-1,2-epoxide hydrolase
LGTEHEDAVRAFIGEWACKQHWVAPQIERMLSCLSTNASYHVFAWEEPFVGHDAIRDELARQAPLFSDTTIETLNVASVGQTVFVERMDSVTMDGRRVSTHVVGVFEVDSDGKIASWRDYLDSREIATHLRREREATGT